MKTDNHQSYGTITRVLHWGMSLLFLGVFGTALAWNINPALKSLMPVHQAFGILLLVLGVVRVIYAMMKRKHRPHNALPAKLGHNALYFLMIIVPASGLAMVVTE